MMKPQIAETGWPTRSMTPANATFQAAVSGIPQLQIFLDTFPCQANTNGTGYFFFETFDEPVRHLLRLFFDLCSWRTPTNILA